MLLRSLAVKNYRSLESVRLDKLERFNVLIGRNNAGKSTVVSALELLSNVLRGNPATQGNVLTFFDINRTLEIQLEFEPHPEDRTEFIGLLVAAHNREDRRDAMLKSPLLRRIEFSFKAPPGSPHMLHLRETRLRTEDNRWAVVQRMEGEENEGNPLSEVVSLGAMSAQFPTTPLDYALLDVANARGIMPGREEPLVQKLRIVYSPFQEHFHADPATTWPQRRLIKYLRDAFFFDPFRHSAEERLPAMHKTELAQNGSDLAQVLNTLSSNERSKFEEIESFVHNALPDIGNLEARLVPGTSETEVNFHYPMEDYRVPIHEMGGGIEQLLMVATVLLTTSQESTIFLEEPESHLHAGAQRFLIERLYAGNRQVFVTTHSPTFVNLPRSRSVYQVAYAEGRTTISRVGDADGLGAVLDDIGARNSDVLLSDAVLFVEGPSDRDALRVWSERSITSLDENNVTVLPMGGGEFAERGARMRGEVLEGISEKAPVPHLFVLDRDERSRGEINRLRRRLTDRVHVLKSRELENYLLVPRALLAAIRSKHHDDAVITGKVDAASEEQVQQLISTTAEGLYELVVIKRIRAAIGGLRGGLLPRETAAALEPHVNSPDLPEVVSKEIESRVADHLSRLKVEKIVRDEKKMLDKEWADSNKHVRLAPGAEIIEEVFRQFGSGYKKPHDTVRIAQEMRAEEISREIGNLINRAVSLTAMEGVTS